MAHSSQTNVMDTHDEAISMDLRYDAEIIPLPETPEKLPVAMKSRVALNDDVPNSVLLTAIDFKRNRWQGCSLLVQEDTASIRSLSSSMSSLARKLKTLTKKLHLWRMWFLPRRKKMNLRQSRLDLDEFKRRWNRRCP